MVLTGESWGKSVSQRKVLGKTIVKMEHFLGGTSEKIIEGKLDDIFAHLGTNCLYNSCL